MKKEIIAIRKQDDIIIQVKLNDESIITIEEAIMMAKMGLIVNINTGMTKRQHRKKTLSNTLYEKLNVLYSLPIF